MWNYLNLCVYLRYPLRWDLNSWPSDKSSTEYNGWEQYVAAKIANSDTSFIPRNNALVLKAVKEKEQADSQAPHLAL
eukprot:7094557-Prymnesium_polylepis.2